MCDLYDRAVQQHLAAAMVGQGIEELRGCLRSVQVSHMRGAQGRNGLKSRLAV